MSSLHPPRPRTLIDWSAAALVAAALFALPVLVLGMLDEGGARWALPLALDVLVLAVHAWRASSPLVVLGAAVVAGVAGIAFFFIVSLGDTCGHGTAAEVAEWTSAVVIGVTLGAWGVLHGLRILWVTPLALACAGVWIVLAAHVVPGGAGGCFN